MVNMERPSGGRDREAGLSRTQSKLEKHSSPENTNWTNWLNWAFTSRSRSRCPDPGRRCPVPLPPANRHSWSHHSGIILTGTLQQVQDLSKRSRTQTPAVGPGLGPWEEVKEQDASSKSKSRTQAAGQGTGPCQQVRFCVPLELTKPPEM